MDLYPQSYYFAGLREISYISEGVRQLCIGKPEYSVAFFKQITQFSARSICHQLSVSKAPPQYKPTDAFPSPVTFNWAALKVAQTFGLESSEESLFVILRELTKLNDKKFTILYEFIASGKQNDLIRPRILVNLYKASRNLFISLVPLYRPLFELFQPEDVIARLPKYDYAAFNALSEKEALSVVIRDAPEIDVSKFPLIMQSAIESRNPNLTFNVQELGPASPFESSQYDMVLKTIRVAITGKQHFDDISLKPLVSVIKRLQFESAKNYSSAFAIHLPLAYIICFPVISKNKQFLEKTLPEVMNNQYMHPIFNQFLTMVSNDITIAENCYKILGQKLSYDDLYAHSVVYYLKDVIQSMNFDNILFLRHMECYSTENENQDFEFIVYYFIISEMLGKCDTEVIYEYIMLLDNKQRILGEMFSLLFIQDEEGNFLFTADQVFRILSLIKDFVHEGVIRKYVIHALNKAKCYEGEELTLNNFLQPSESIVYDLVVKKKWELAEPLGAISTKVKMLIELFVNVDLYANYEKNTGKSIKNVVCQPKDLPEEIQEMFNIELGLSTCNRYCLEQSKHSKSIAGEIIQNRLEQEDPLSCFELNPMHVKRVKDFDSMFLDINNTLERQERVAEYSNLNSLIDYVNGYIAVGAKTVDNLNSIDVMETINTLIGTLKFDLALEFAGINGIDFFQYLFAKYNADESTLKLISPRYPLPSLTMALFSLNGDELERFRDIVVPSDASKQLLAYYDRKVHPPKEHVRKAVINVILSNSEDIDDYLYNEDPAEICEAVYQLRYELDLKRLNRLLDFCACFTDRDDIQHLREMVMFLTELDNPPNSLPEVEDVNKTESRISELINNRMYIGAKRFAEYTHTTNLFLKHIKIHITTLIESNGNYTDAMIRCREYSKQIFESIDISQYKVRYVFLRTFPALLENKEYKDEYRSLSVYFYIGEKSRPSSTKIADIISELTDKANLFELERLAKKFKLDFTPVINRVTQKTIDVVSSFGVSISLPILVPIILSVLDILNEYGSFAKYCQRFGEIFLPIIHHISAFILVDCVEHEAFCSQVIMLFRVMLHKIYVLCCEDGKKEINKVLSILKLISYLESVSFFARYRQPYSYDILKTGIKNDIIHTLLVNSDFLDIASNFSNKNIMSKMSHFFILLKMHEFAQAREEFSHFADSLKASDFQVINEFITMLFWALKSPLCLDEEWMSTPIADIAPLPMHISVANYIKSRISAFYPSHISECAYYAGVISTPADKLRILASNGSFKQCFVIMSKMKNGFDSSLFIQCVLINSLSTNKVNEMFSALKEFDQYLSLSMETLDDTIQWCKRMGLPRLKYIVSMIVEDFEEAVYSITEIYASETSAKKRKEILETCKESVPYEVLALNLIYLQEEFVSLLKEKNINVAPSVHLFGEAVHSAMFVLFTNKLYSFAMKVASEMNVDPLPSVKLFIQKNSNKKVRKLVEAIGKNALPDNPSLYEKWTSLILKELISNPKNKSATFTIIQKEIKDPRFKCNLFIQIGYPEEAKKIAIKEKLNEFIELLSF